MDKSHWSIAEARLHLAEVIRRSRRSPQLLENRGREVAAVVDVELLEELKGRGHTTRGARLLERLAALSEEGGLEASLKSLPRDVFADMGDE